MSFTLPRGYVATTPNAGNDATDSDGLPSGNAAVTGNYGLNAGQSIPTVDQGLWRPASLGDYVWEDLNHNGQQDDGNTGINSVPVALLNSSNNVVSTTTTFTGGPATPPATTPSRTSSAAPTMSASRCQQATWRPRPTRATTPRTATACPAATRR